MGKSQRNKGARGERSLVMHLRLLGYDARRVIRTRAVGGYENDVVPDVVVYEGDAIKYSFENKYRKNAFKTIYNLYERERRGSKTLRFSYSKAGPFVAVGYDFEEVKLTADVHFTQVDLESSKDARTYKRILGLNKLLKGAQFLVIKDNGKFPLFLRFWV